MEQQIDILKTGRLSWDIVSRILEETVFELLRKKIRIKAWAEDKDYWGAIAQDYRFSLDDLNRLMDSVQANSTVRLRTLPEDDTTTNSFGMDWESFCSSENSRQIGLIGILRNLACGCSAIPAAKRIRILRRAFEFSAERQAHER